MFKRTFLLVGGLSWALSAFSYNLSLKEAERLALRHSAMSLALKEKSEAEKEKALSQGQLADPKLFLGLMNVPADTFDFDQENMTQIQVGIEQAFPKGQSLRYQYSKTDALSMATAQQQADLNLKIKEALRLNWSALVFWQNAQRIHQKEQEAFKHLVDVAEAMLSNNKSQQQDVFRARLGEIGAQNKLIKDRENIEAVKIKLARLLGHKTANRISVQSFPSWLVETKQTGLSQRLMTHPRLQADASLIAEKKAAVLLAKEQFKPGFMAGAAFGIRQGSAANGKKRSDFVTLRLGINAPLFPEMRQSKVLNFAEKAKCSQEAKKLEDYRALYEQYQKALVDYHESKERLRLYEKDFLLESQLYVQATLAAYQNAKADFPNLARAYVRQFNVEIEAERAKLERVVAEINLLYLQGK